MLNLGYRLVLASSWLRGFAAGIGRSTISALGHVRAEDLPDINSCVSPGQLHQPFAYDIALSVSYISPLQ